MHIESLKIAEVEIEVTFKPIKNLHLSVHPPEGRVTIASPDFYDLEKVKIYAASKLGWIKKEQRKFRDQAREDERLMITRESHYLFGERYLLDVRQSNRNSIQILGKKMILHVKDVEDLQLKKAILYRFYRKELRNKLKVMVQQYAALLRVDVPEFKIRVMKTKWGSCATDLKRIWFNIELAKKPIDCIEYIVVHELVHLLERNHNKRFILLMDQYSPSWRTQKKLLNDLPIGII
ncbi:M48 family metallopeptidase [Sphingobacterium faecale]|uniref:M48 family metallopeptidase n=1 Tax=Sphingobacterium faecale TaxID=2803775 RepID=A0ABS1R8Q1_9SPHI|nr:SprT family zinc-dependent metalloprotease [Sphingobacterium faecale]MBL1411091.1 M48 family metallopeptidase [Sphingobacterium faecale]